MVLFFDLSIPYLERDGGGLSSENKARKDARLRAVVRAMELGYVGVAYDRPFRSVLSDADRCKIVSFPLSSLLKVAPALAASSAFHRDLLGAPLASPFRQYTRLTVSVHGAAAAVSLNGNAMLKTYDLVALRPLNQDAFDKACESSQVDIIALDFSQKLPFRLKLPSIKLAIQRGLYFEITYSHLIADVHVRRQILSDAKLLADWTRGKNIIFSSAAPTVNEIRGPHDVVNLTVYLLGLSLERAKAAISGNCRSLLANALRKKHFYKETIRIERILPDEQSNSKGFWFDGCNEWDPISSEKGDLPSLDNIIKDFPSTSRPSFISNSIDFMSIMSEPPFFLGENAATMSSTKKLRSLAAPSERHSAAAAVAVATKQVAIDGDVATLHSKEPCQAVEVNECLKFSDESDMVSQIGKLPSATAASKFCDHTYNDDADILPSNADPTSLTVMENKPSDMFMEVLQSDNRAIETSNDAAEFMDCIPDNDDHTLKACNYADHHDLLPSSADPTSLVVMENKPADMFVEVQKSLYERDNHVVETSNDAAELMDCVPDVAGDQISLYDEGPCLNDFMGKKMLQGHDIPRIVEQELKDEILSDHCMPLQNSLLQSVLSDKGAGLISSVDDVLSKDALKETKVQEEQFPYFEIDSPVEKNMIIFKEEIQKSETKLGGRKHKERLFYPAYPLPFKGLFKPMLFKKKLCKLKRTMKHL